MMTALSVTPAYSALLVRFPPRVIRTDEQNDGYISALRQLEQHQASWTSEEAELADLLTLLIEDYEEKQFQLPTSTPLDTIHFLMDQHGLEQEDLNALLGSPSLTADVMTGHRDLDKEQIRRLADRFHVSPELFF